MRKSHKKALGLLGLAAVVGMTAVAANLPTPAGAVTSATDTITVTVVRDEAGILITSPEDDVEVNKPRFDVTVSASRLKSLKLSVVYTKNGVTLTKEVESINLTAAESATTVDKSFTIDLTDEDFPGPGKYTIIADGIGEQFNTPVSSAIQVRYQIPEPPKTGSVTQQLNISRADYLATGLIVFGLALVGAIVLFAKKKNQKRR